MADRKISALPSAETQDLTSSQTVVPIMNAARGADIDKNRKATWADVKNAMVNEGLLTDTSSTDGQVLRRASGVVGFGEIATAGIGDLQVTNAKLASGIDAAKITTGTLPIARIADGAITTAKIGDTQVTNVKLDSGIDAGKITTGTLPIARIGANAIDAAKIIATGLAGYVVQIVYADHAISRSTTSTTVSDATNMTISVTPKGGSNTLFFFWVGTMDLLSSSGLSLLGGNVLLTDSSNNIIADSSLAQESTTASLKQVGHNVCLVGRVTSPGTGAKTYKTRFLRPAFTSFHTVTITDVRIVAIELAV